MELLDNPIRDYAWGSRTAIAAMQGRSPTENPEAELWMGAHPDSPSTLTRHGVRARLDDVIAAEPGLLGADTVAEFGPRLPFMLKVLAAASPLSLQAHPDSATAARRYADEASVPADQRLYRDPFAKPELLVALDDFDTLCGFRDPSISADVLASLGVPALASVIETLRAGDAETRLRSATAALLKWPAPTRAAVVDAVVASARRRSLGYIADLGERFAGDMGVVVAVLLNHVKLSAGEAIWMPAGNLHAYLRGTGMEVLATSDNVLRGGFTAKRVDVDELMHVLRYEVLAEPVVKPVAPGPGIRSWPVPATDFALLQVTLATSDAPVVLTGSGPRIVFCLTGSVHIDDGSPVDLVAGKAAFGPAGPHLALSGDGEVFVATTPTVTHG